MTVAHPRADIFTDFPILTQRFYVQRFQDVSTYRGGRRIVVDLAPPAWRGEFASAPLRHRECTELEAMLNSLNGAAEPFYATDTRRWRPQAASVDFADTGQVNFIDLNNNTFSLTNLPQNLNGLVSVTRGDLVSVTYGSGADQRTTVLEYAEGGPFWSGGNTPLLQFTTPIPPQVAAGDAARLFDPQILMQIEPGTVEFSDRGDGMGTVSFKATEYR